MALKRLTSEEMLHISASWVDAKGPSKAIILACADTAPSFPRIQAAHNLLTSLAQPVGTSQRLAAISAELSEVDARHDDIVRGVNSHLTGGATLLGTAEDAGKALLALRDKLLPDGLESINKSYRAEAGQAKQLAERLTKELRAELAAIIVGPKTDKQTLADYVDEWLALGKRLGALQDERDRLENGASTSALNDARLAWIRAVNALVANAELANLDDATMSILFGPLNAAERAAERRGKSGKSQAPASPQPQPAPVEKPTGG